MKISVESSWKSRIQRLLCEDDTNDDLKDITFEVKDREGHNHQIKCHKLVLGSLLGLLCGHGNYRLHGL